MHDVGNMYFVIKVLDLFQSSFPQVYQQSTSHPQVYTSFN